MLGGRTSSVGAVLLASCSAFGGKVEATDGGMADGGASFPEAGSSSAFCTTINRTDFLFCDDFEQGTGLANWRVADSDAPARYGTSTEGFASKVAARLELLPHPNNDADARIERVFNERTYTWVRLELVLRLLRREEADADLVNVAFGQSGTLKLRALGNIVEVARFGDGGAKPGNRQGPASPIPVGEWITVAMEFDLKRGASKATVVVRGADVVRDLALDRTEGASPFSIRLGPAETPSPIAGWLVEVDNVVVRGRP